MVCSEEAVALGKSSSARLHLKDEGGPKRFAFSLEGNLWCEPVRHIRQHVNAKQVFTLLQNLLLYRFTSEKPLHNL